MPNGTALEITPGQLSAAELAGVGLAEALGQQERVGIRRGVELGRTRAVEQESAIKRQEEREKKRRRTAELFQLAGTVAGFLIPGGAIFGAARLAGAGVGARLGGAAGTLFAGRPPGAAARALPGALGAVGEFQERRAFQRQQPRRRRQFDDTEAGRELFGSPPELMGPR